MNHLTEEQIALAADLQLNGKYNKLPDKIRDHLSSCDQCAHEVIMVNEVLKDSSKKKVAFRRYRTLTYSLAAAALLILITFSFLFRNMKPGKDISNQNEQIAQTTSDSVTNRKKNKTEVPVKTDHTENKQLKKQDQLAKKKVVKKKPTKPQKKENVQIAQAEYKTHPQLEQLVSRYRQGNLRAAEILNFDKDIKYPNRKKIILPNDKRTYIMEIYNNKGIMISEISTEDTQDTIINIPELKQGLYYWKLINQDFDLLYVGRIKAVE